MSDIAACPLCLRATPRQELAEAGWVDDAVAARLTARAPHWHRADGACPACVQQAILTLLLERGEGVLGRVVQALWPLDAEAAFGALPTPLRMRADPRVTGAGVTIAVVDAMFQPHDDLVRPRNRIRAWVDASRDVPLVRQFDDGHDPSWPGSDDGAPGQWHGLMTSATAAGNGHLSHGLYRGLAPDAHLVLVQAMGADGRIGPARLLGALRWLVAHHAEFGIRVVNLSLGVSADDPVASGEVEAMVEALVDRGVAVVAAAGNEGERTLALPARAPSAVTVGGLDDRNVVDAGNARLWHSNYGSSTNGGDKPELVAPSLWVVAPVLPRTPVAGEAAALFERRAAGDRDAEPRIAELRLVTPHYQHVEGTSFASPIVSGVAACMLEACPALSVAQLRALLLGACLPVSGASRERQGAGAIDAGRAVAAAFALANGTLPDVMQSPHREGNRVHVALQDLRARSVRLVGSWDGWRTPGTAASLVAPGTWSVTPGPLAPGRYTYKLLLDDSRWIPDPLNPWREGDGLGGWNSVIDVR